MLALGSCGPRAAGASSVPLSAVAWRYSGADGQAGGAGPSRLGRPGWAVVGCCRRRSGAAGGVRTLGGRAGSCWPCSVAGVPWRWRGSRVRRRCRWCLAPRPGRRGVRAGGAGVGRWRRVVRGLAVGARWHGRSGVPAGTSPVARCSRSGQVVLGSAVGLERVTVLAWPSRGWQRGGQRVQCGRLAAPGWLRERLASASLRASSPLAWGAPDRAGPGRRLAAWPACRDSQRGLRSRRARER